MNQEQVDYSAVLTDLKERRAKLDATILAIEEMLGITGEAPSDLGQSSNTSKKNEGKIRSDSFFGMSVGDAARKYLEIVKAPKSAKEIMQALEDGGLTHTSKHFYGTVFTALVRREKNEGDITKVKSEWGLTEWYPGLKKGKRNSGKDNSSNAESQKNVDTKEKPGL